MMLLLLWSAVFSKSLLLLSYLTRIIGSAYKSTLALLLARKTYVCVTGRIHSGAVETGRMIFFFVFIKNCAAHLLRSGPSAR